VFFNVKLKGISCYGLWFGDGSGKSVSLLFFVQDRIPCEAKT